MSSSSEIHGIDKTRPRNGDQEQNTWASNWFVRLIFAGEARYKVCLAADYRTIHRLVKLLSVTRQPRNPGALAQCGIIVENVGPRISQCLGNDRSLALFSRLPTCLALKTPNNNNWNVCPFEVVCRDRDPQFQVSKNYSNNTIWTNLSTLMLNFQLIFLV